jgi:polyhydroxybutyrate depolymerase
MRLATLVCVVIVAAACGGSPVASTQRSSPSAVTDCRGSSEIGSTPPTATGVSYVEMTVDGRLRDYRLFTPPTLDTTKPFPLALMLHGSPIDAAGWESFIHFDQEATAGRFMVASPNGCNGYWLYSEGGPKAADEDFIRAVVQQLEARYPVDRSKVFLVGASAGTWVEYRLACDMAGMFAAVASVAGTMRLSDSCRPSRPVSILEMHGTLDHAHPWNGGGDHHAFPVEAVVQKWTQLDGCTGDPVVTTTGITVTSVWIHCQGGAIVRLDKVVGGQHQWFGSDIAPVPGEPNANMTIWSFVSGLF